MILALSAYISIFTTLTIIAVLGKESYIFFQQVSIWEFLFGTHWEPLLEPKSFGVLPLLAGTLLIVVGSGLIAIPTGLMTAVYLSEYASERTRSIIKPIMEVLAGIPTVVYGYFALTFITPMIRLILPDTQIFNALSASIVVGIMILPMVASLCDDAIRSVPISLRQGGYALGATPFEVTKNVTVPAAFSGIIASFVLAVSRAFGETMAVTLAAGATPNLTLNPLESIQTMTAYIVQVSLGDTPAGGIEYQTIFAVGALLFVVTLGMNVAANWIMNRYREVYE
jgi:phosphate transport system permease protein|tara:strand:- start:39 stop:887 length:849 start_codon:yes stop_codon:yes gene_type:complete